MTRPTETAPATSRWPVTPEGAAVEALSDAVGAVAGLLDVESVLQLIVDRVRDLVGARYAALGTLADHRRIESFITSGITAAQRELLGPLPEGHGLLGLIITEGRSIRIPEISAHPASYGFPPNHPPMHSLLGVPVRVRNRPIGNLYLTDKVDAAEFSADDQRLVELFALHAGIAIENARLHLAVQRLAVVDERERIAKDLHDGIIQSLYAIALSLEDVPALMTELPDEAVGRVDRAIDDVNRTIGDLRGFIVGLHAAASDDADLADLLAALAESLRQRTGTAVEFDVTSGPVELPPHARAELLLIAREAFSNIARHADAATVRVSLTHERDRVRLDIVDDGRGFDPDHAAHDGHYGLANMRDRAEALGGSLELASQPSSGTRIIVRIPVPGNPTRPTTNHEDAGR